jgi:nicotinamide-nucleotide adenylyltransferase
MKALFIGRFQPFHKGHLLLLQHIAKEYDELIIGIGSSQYHDTAENPFSEAERKQMITQSLAAVDLHSYHTVSIPDIHDPPRWVDHVCSLVPQFDVVIANNSFTRHLFEEKGFLVKGTSYFNREFYSGKEIRRRIMAGESWNELVPEAVVKIIQNVHGVERIKNIPR